MKFATRQPRGYCGFPIGRTACWLFTFLLVSLFGPLAFAASFKTSFDQTVKRQDVSGDTYLLGVGKADITGPVVEIGFAGYADLEQTGTGLRQRLYSRAFIIGDVDNPNDRFVYLVLDTHSGDTAVRNGILEGLAALGEEYGVYDKNNVAVTGTHSHAGPGAWFNYLLPQITNLGFDEQSYRAIVDGAVLSVRRAHEALTEVSRSRISSCLCILSLHPRRRCRP